MNQNKNKLIGILFFIIHLLFSVTNDALMKFLSQDISFWQVMFLRVSLGGVFVVPILAFQKENYFITKNIKVHIYRSLLFFFGLLTWLIGLSNSYISIATTIGFMLPIFTLILARVILNEAVSIGTWIATAVCFIGMTITINSLQNLQNNIYSIFFIISTLLFAFLDITNKKYVSKEPLLTILFYSNLITSLFCLVPAVYFWKPMNSLSLCISILLSLGGNLLLYFLLRSLKYSDISTLSPFKYLELVFSIMIGTLVFGEQVNASQLIGAGIIICSSFYIFLKKYKNRY